MGAFMLDINTQRTKLPHNKQLNIMSVYLFLRYGLASILLIGWVFFQRIIKKRKWVDLKGDAFAVLFFVAIWFAIAYLFMH